MSIMLNNHFNTKKMNKNQKNWLAEMMSRVHVKPGKNIPRVLHQMWVGKNPMPDVYKRSLESWLKHNPKWDYKLWRDPELDAEGLRLAKFYNKHPDIYLMKGDLAKYEIMARYGGFYADVDMIFLRPFDRFTGYDFIAPLDFISTDFEIYNFVYGCAPGNPVMMEVVNRVTDEGFDPKAGWVHYFHYFSPYYFTKVVRSVVGKYKNCALFPTDYFAPWPSRLRKKPETMKDYIKKHTHAVHLWGCSWEGQV